MMSTFFSAQSDAAVVRRSSSVEREAVDRSRQKYGKSSRPVKTVHPQKANVTFPTRAEAKENSAGERGV